MKTIGFELKRAFQSTSLKISLFLGTLICLMDLGLFCLQYGLSGNNILIQAWIGTDYRFAYNSLFYVLLPILACLPYAGSYFVDMDSGYEKNICIKTSRKKYLWAKSIAVFLSAFFSVTFPLTINLFICAGLYPNHVPEKLDFLSAGIIDCNMFPNLFNQKPLWYCILFILIDGLFAGLLGMMSLCVSKWVKSHFTAVVIPFVIYILTGVLFVSDNGKSLSMMEMVNPVQRYITQFYQMMLLYIIILSLCGFVVWLWSRKRDIL